MNYESIDLIGLADRLTAARRDAGITQEAAAAHIGVSRPTFIAMEKGARRPKPEELVRLADLYKIALNRLLRDGARPQELRPHLRSVLNASPEGNEDLELAVRQLTGYIDDYQSLERLVGSKTVTHFPQPIRIPSRSIGKFAEHCAQQERARLNLGLHQPIASLRKVLEEAGMHVFVDKVSSRLAGLYVFVPEFGYCILVNRSHPRERRRWTIAHEYGHFLADRDRPGVDFLKGMQRKSESEKFADAFAAAFLMPEAGVQQRFYEELERTGDFKVGDLCRLADHFAVSVMAMALRLESTGLVQRGTWDRIAEERVRIQDLKKEAGIDTPKEEKSIKPYPQRYKLLAAQAFVDEKISEGQLAKYLRCSRLEARDIVEACSKVMNDEEGERVSFSLSHSLLA